MTADQRQRFARGKEMVRATRRPARRPLSLSEPARGNCKTSAGESSIESHRPVDAAQRHRRIAIVSNALEYPADEGIRKTTHQIAAAVRAGGGNAFRLSPEAPWV